MSIIDVDALMHNTKKYHKYKNFAFCSLHKLTYKNITNIKNFSLASRAIHQINNINTNEFTNIIKLKYMSFSTTKFETIDIQKDIYHKLFLWFFLFIK